MVKLYTCTPKKGRVVVSSSYYSDNGTAVATAGKRGKERGENSIAADLTD